MELFFTDDIKHAILKYPFIASVGRVESHPTRGLTLLVKIRFKWYFIFAPKTLKDYLISLILSDLNPLMFSDYRLVIKPFGLCQL